MKGLIKECVNFLNDDTKHASEKFWKLEKRMEVSSILEISLEIGRL